MNSTVIREKMLINGKWVGSEHTHKVYNKYTKELFSEIAVADEKLVDQAIKAAVNAHEQTTFTPEHRYQVLMRMADLLLEKQEELAMIITKEVGKPIADANVEVMRSVSTLQLSAEEAKKLVGEIIPNYNAQGRFLYTVKKPIGVIAAITPFNFPLNLIVHKLGPALAAGNPVILKPASNTATVAIKLCQLFVEAGVPKGYVQCVIGSGRTVGEQLLQDERIAHYTFTGSPEVGKHIQETIGLRKATLELGSNSATIVHSDANIDKAATKLSKMAFSNAGQVCISVQRMYVHESVYDAFLKKFLDEVALLTVGDPLHPDTDIGPMISEKEAKRVEQWVQEAKEAGAQILTGNKRVGSVFYPTVITNAETGMKIVDEEIFGPVVTITPYHSLEEAIDLVNHSKYGLQAGIYTSDLNLSYQIPYLLDVGGVVINDTCCYRADQMPYGGVKESGNGKEGPAYAIQELVKTVTVVVNLE
ncbi:aldehyde dehydrogenase family protein [Virgibacillus pantothenticus]|uniref:aldehyde dehydrogenase family protein n=1 Tax=Virgibacillus pantothenticus TaxID=1473 RepID=UPI001C22F88B|nr:aldehyde dehydrogenase family protein [Virgibacillus pantothenticus]MBU8568541.1 aldehyde dehydrogenase family protein [Virgibacillus pantothenticus]MBU8602488.1 aldehyde dehydrogenase family protein [Virgibacillus pantothenticus]MBU8636671.1 aldehyde dehydrogenase family protein [Virgibacillus pantothenticus]MBU8644351.1 aldehyde dehydrogenase family protein [Virgibacillus pantothenticus]MBU8648489.1 aldehyde dehydrogenase family protein [Virgibacillus pantothenticus]